MVSPPPRIAMASPPPSLPCDADCYTEQYILQIVIPVGIIAFLANCCLCYGCPTAAAMTTAAPTLGPSSACRADVQRTYAACRLWAAACPRMRTRTSRSACRNRCRPRWCWRRPPSERVRRTQRSRHFQSQSAANNNRSGSGSLVLRRAVHLRSRWQSRINSYSLHVAATSRSRHSTALALRHGCSASSRAPKHSP